MSRPRYVPSGKCDWAAIWPMLLALVVVSALFAVVYALLTKQILYFIFLSWAITGFICGFIAKKSIEMGKCRHHLFISAFVFFCGFAMQLGIYHIDQCWRWGVPWSAVDRIPGYITFRMETDTLLGDTKKSPIIVPHAADPRIKPYIEPRISTSGSWWLYFLEVLVMAILPAGYCWWRASRPYSEQLQTWYSSIEVRLTSKSASLLRQALKNNTFTEWVTAQVEKSVDQFEGVVVKLFYCPKPEDSSLVEPEMYLKVGTSAPELMTIEEAASLTELFPEVIGWVESPLDQLDEQPPTDIWQAPLAIPISADVATVQKVPPPYRGRLKDPHVKKASRPPIVKIFMHDALCQFFVVFLASIGLTFLVSLFGNDSITKIFAICTAVLIFGGILNLRLNYDLNADDIFVKHRIEYYLTQMLLQARKRADALFTVTAPGVCYCESHSRKKWADHTSNEPGSHEEGSLLVFDDANRRLLFEGDEYRWVIPYCCIKHCDAEKLNDREGLYAVVIQFWMAKRTHELPLIPFAGVPGKTHIERLNALHQIVSERVAANTKPTPLAYSEQIDAVN